jgi:hypothetical protein
MDSKWGSDAYLVRIRQSACIARTGRLVAGVPPLRGRAQRRVGTAWAGGGPLKRLISLLPVKPIPILLGVERSSHPGNVGVRERARDHGSSTQAAVGQDTKQQGEHGIQKALQRSRPEACHDRVIRDGTPGRLPPSPVLGSFLMLRSEMLSRMDVSTFELSRVCWVQQPIFEHQPWQPGPPSDRTSRRSADPGRCKSLTCLAHEGEPLWEWLSG